jgi:hypothetical protein
MLSGTFFVTMNVVMLSFVKKIVFMLDVVMLTFVRMIAFMLNVDAECCHVVYCIAECLRTMILSKY